jgi:hypothetical protein
MPDRIFALKLGTMLCAGLLAVAGGYAGAQTAPSSLPPVVAMTPPAVPPSTPVPAVTSSFTTTSTLATYSPSASDVADHPAIPTVAGTTKQPAPASTTTSASAPSPTSTPNSTGIAWTDGRIAAVASHGVTGTVVRWQGQSFIIRPRGGTDVRVSVDRETIIRSQSGGTGQMPQPGDHAVVVGAPRPDGALAARAMLISPPAPTPSVPSRRR